MRIAGTKLRLAALALLPLTAAATVALSGCASKAETAEPVRPAIVAQPLSAAGEAGTLYTGDVRARYESALGFRVGGKIKRRLVDVGAHVETGQLIAELDPADLNLQAASARASVAAAEADAAMAQSERERYAALRDKHFVSATAFDAVDNKLKAANARLSEVRAARSVAQNQADYSALRADHAGVITNITAEAGQVVASGQTIASLARDGEREVEISVPEGRIGSYHLGQAAIVAAWADANKPITGSLREIAPEADAVTRTFRVRVTLDANPAAVMKLGQTARVFFAGDTEQSAQLVPLAALYEKDGKPALWRLDTKTKQVHLVSVTVSAYREQGVLIANGLDAQDWVVSAGVHKLHEGQAVLPVDGNNRQLKL